MANEFHWGPANPHPLSKMRTELVWDGKYDEYVSQTATPSNTSGVTGDKPIETIGEVGKTALTGGTSTVLKQAANAAGLTGTTTNTNVEKAAAAAGSACADGSCAKPAAK